MANTIKLNKKILLDELDLPYEAIEDKIIDTTRWSEIHEIVFAYEGKFWGTGYSCGKTEQQDEGPWEYADDEVECVEMEKVTKTVEVWEVKK